MKKIFFYACVISGIMLFATACTKTALDDFDENEESRSGSKYSQLLEELGFDTDDVAEFDDYFIVDGDIEISKESLDELSISQTKHIRGGTPISAANQANIQFYFPNGHEAGYYEACLEAAKAWSSVEGCNIKITYSATSSANSIAVRFLNEEDPYWTGALERVCATGAYPTGGKVGNEIKINRKYNDFSHRAKVFLIAHEMGHCLGLGHTNWKKEGDAAGTHISTTPNYSSSIPTEQQDPDPESVMNGSTGGRLWKGFSFYDQLAIRTVYPTAKYAANVVLTSDADGVVVGDTITVEIKNYSQRPVYDVVWDPSNRFQVILQSNTKCVVKAVERSANTFVDVTFKVEGVEYYRPKNLEIFSELDLNFNLEKDYNRLGGGDDQFIIKNRLYDITLGSGNFFSYEVLSCAAETYDKSRVVEGRYKVPNILSSNLPVKCYVYYTKRDQVMRAKKTFHIRTNYYEPECLLWPKDAEEPVVLETGRYYNESLLFYHMKYKPESAGGTWSVWDVYGHKEGVDYSVKIHHGCEMTLFYYTPGTYNMAYSLSIGGKVFKSYSNPFTVKDGVISSIYFRVNDVKANPYLGTPHPYHAWVTTKGENLTYEWIVDPAKGVIKSGGDSPDPVIILNELGANQITLRVTATYQGRTYTREETQTFYCFKVPFSD